MASTLHGVYERLFCVGKRQVEIHSFGSGLHVYGVFKWAAFRNDQDTYRACKSHQPELFQLFR